MKKTAQKEKTRIDLLHKNKDKKEHDHTQKEPRVDYLTRVGAEELGVEKPHPQ